MKRYKEKGLIGIMVSAAILYLLFAAAFWQAAKADECEWNQVCMIHNMANSGEDQWELVAATRIADEIMGYTGGFIDALATVAVHGSEEPGTDWAKTYDTLNNEFQTCGLYTMTNNEVARAWLTYTVDKKNMGVRLATVFFMNTACGDEIGRLSKLFATPATKPSTKS